MTTMKQWLDAYGKSHQNSTNKLIHWICVPVIFVSLIGLLSLIPLPFATTDDGFGPYVHFGTLLIAIGLLFYVRLSAIMTIGMTLVSAFSLYIVKWVNLTFWNDAWMVFTSAFVLAWIGQFIGHKIEGEKPSFFDDLKFLLIGPAWLLAFVLKKMGVKY